MQVRNRDGFTSATEAAAIASLMQEAFALETRYANVVSAAGPAGAASQLDLGPNGKLYSEAKRIVQSRLKAGGAMASVQLPALIAQHAGSLSKLLPTEDARVLLGPSFAPIPSVILALDSLQSAALDTSKRPFERVEFPDATSACNPCRRLYANESAERSGVIAAAQAAIARGECAGVTIVVPSLATTREVWRRALVEANASFNISLGSNLSSFSDVAVWLTLLSGTFGESPDVESTAQALRHGRWGLSRAQLQRVSAQEIEWLSRGKKRASFNDFAPVINALAIAPIDRRRSQSRSAWLQTWQSVAAQMLQSEVALDSASFQLRAAVERVGKSWRELDHWLPALTASEALSEWRDQLSSTPFQPENPGASIEVMGLLESAGTINDALWVTGLTDTVLPERSRLNPFLSASWQRSAGIGLASLDECAARADRLWRGWGGMSQSFSVSTAKFEAGHTLLASPFIASIPFEIGTTPATTAAPLIASQDECDVSALSVTAKLNAYGLEAQAVCPRRGWALGRLRAKVWPERFDGLSPLVRGTLLHKVAERLGQDRIAAHALGKPVNASDQLARLPDHIRAAIELARAETHEIPDDLWALEAERLYGLFEKFIALEADREAFVVLDVEHEATHEIGGVSFNLRMDRIERLSDETLAILDFKSGASMRTGLTDMRLSSPQLPLYAMALQQMRAADAAAVSAVSFVQVNDDAVKYVGLADDGDAQLALRTSRQTQTFSALKERWPVQLAALVSEFKSGVATVAPLSGAQTCNRCGMQRLCRVDLRLLNEANE